MNFTLEGMEGEAKAVSRLRSLREKLETATDQDGDRDPALVESLDSSRQAFDACIDDDLNLSGALGVLHERARLLGRELPCGVAAADALEFLTHCDEILGVLFVEQEVAGDSLTQQQQDWIDQREQARQSRDWDLADSLRDQLKEVGILVEDGPQGPTWTRIR